MSQLEIAVTTHHDPLTTTMASVVQNLRQFTDGEVSIEQNGWREGRATVHLTDEVAALFDSGRDDYLYRMFVRYHGVPAIWAPIKTEWSASGDYVTLIAKDADRLENHYLRDGDPAIDNAPITADYQGMRLLRDAANNTSAQDTRGVVPLGIKNGSDDLGARASATATFSRWDQVASSMVQLAQGAIDFELAPLDISTLSAGDYNYMALNTYADQGTDRITGAGAMAFHCNYGLNNLSDHRASPDQFYTHVHAHGDGSQDRVTAYHADSSRYRGIYVRETASQYTDPDETELTAVAESFIRAYGLPTHTFELELRPDALQQWVALVASTGYGIGDRVLAGVKKGYYNREDTVRIVGLRLRQADRTRQTVADMTVVNEVVEDADIGTTEIT